MAGKAKTSARSKGYRKQEKKRPFLTKKEIIALVAIVAAIGLGVLLFNLLYSDGSLKLVDGVPQTENLESSLLATQSVNDETHYYKVGEAGQIEGYTRETVEGVIAYAPSYQYMPDDAEAPIDSLTVRAGNRTAAEMATVMLSNYVYNSGIFGEVPNGIQETDLDGRHVYYLISNHEYQDDSSATDDAATDATATDDAATSDTATEATATDDAATSDTATDSTATDDAATSDAATSDAATDATATDDAATSDTATDATTTDDAATDDAATDTTTADTTASEAAYICTQELTAFVQSDMNENFSVCFEVTVQGTSEAGLDEEALAAYTDSLYLTEEELLNYLAQAVTAVYPAQDAQ